MEEIEVLLDCLRNIDYSQFGDDRIDTLLDCRDCEPFDSELCRVDSEIARMKNQYNYTFQSQQDQIRKEAFFIVESNIGSELADYISDDFGLIFDSIVIGYKDEWLSKLIDTYRNGKIPFGNL